MIIDLMVGDNEKERGTFSAQIAQLVITMYVTNYQASQLDDVTAPLQILSLHLIGILLSVFQIISYQYLYINQLLLGMDIGQE